MDDQSKQTLAALLANALRERDAERSQSKLYAFDLANMEAERNKYRELSERLKEDLRVVRQFINDDCLATAREWIEAALMDNESEDKNAPR